MFAILQGHHHHDDHDTINQGSLPALLTNTPGAPKLVLLLIATGIFFFPLIVARSSPQLFLHFDTIIP